MNIFYLQGECLALRLINFLIKKVFEVLFCSVLITLVSLIEQCKGWLLGIS